MLLIPCPHCGPREETEYRCGGEADLARPGVETSSEQDWANYLFSRSNRRGLHLERWCHLHGCGCWFIVARDTVSHRIEAVYGAITPTPACSDQGAKA